MNFSKESVKENIKYYFKHNIPIFIHLVWKNKFELGFAIFGILSLVLSANLYFTTVNNSNTDKELKESREEILLLSKELKKYYLMEQDLLEAGASASQASDIIKSVEMLHSSDLARNRLGK
jgi:hypothetical protein